MMRNSTPERVQDDTGCEFAPPIGLAAMNPEILGVPWERQIEAAVAWQAAGGDADGEQQAPERGVASMVPPLEHTGVGAGMSAPTMHTIMRMNTLMVSLRERLLQIQTEAANVAIAEMGRRKSGPGEAEAATAEGVPQLPQLHEDHGRRIDELARSWFDIVASAQAGMTAITGYVPGGAQGAGERQAFVERRQRAVLIDFPDRRLAS